MRSCRREAAEEWIAGVVSLAGIRWSIAAQKHPPPYVVATNWPETTRFARRNPCEGELSLQSR